MYVKMYNYREKNVKKKKNQKNDLIDIYSFIIVEVKFGSKCTCL